MTEATLHDRRILVVEDEYMVADSLQEELTDNGAVVVGPVATVQEALDLIRAEPAIDAAIVDVNLSGEMAFAVADLLTERKVPFLMTTGYDSSVIPARFVNVARCEKPTKLSHITDTISAMVYG